jgi:dTDP-4-dehydrorhamnose reductase
MRWLVTGAGGMLGQDTVDVLRGRGEDVTGLGRAALDITEPAAVDGALAEHRPDIMVNCAAYTAVDAAETDQSTCLRVNAESPAVLAEESARLGATLIHFSTNYVFDGTLDRPYREDDPATPESVYGRSKLLGEAAVAANPAHLILRLAAVYATTGRNFLLRILDLSREREELRVVEDQLVAPTPASAVADATVGIVGGLLDGTNRARSGVHHLTCSGSTSWYGFAERILALDPRREEQRVRRLVPVSSTEFAAAAPRPLNGLLDCGLASRELGVTLPDWELELERVMTGLAN